MSSHAAAGSARGRHLGWALALLAFAQLIEALDYNIVYISLPRIGAELGFSDQTLQWVVSGYAVTFAGFLLFGGRAADLLGRRRMFMVALSLYGAGSLVGGLAVSPWMLVLARATQGLGGALLVPATLSLINTTFPEGPERNRALAVWGAAGGSGLAIGSVLGGVITSGLGWEWVFLVNVPLTVGGIVAALFLLPADGPRERGRPFDLPGALVATAGVTLLVFALAQGPELGWASPPILASVGLGIGLVAAFLVLEARVADPLMPLRLFRIRSLSSAMAVTIAMGGSFAAQFYLLTVYLQNVLEFGPLAAGLTFLPYALVIAVGNKVAARMVTRAGTRTVLAVGFLVGAVGMVLFWSGVGTDGTFGGLLPGLLVIAAGTGITWTAMWITSSAGVEPESQGVASGMGWTTWQVGVAVGLAVVVAITNAGVGPDTASALADGLRTAFLTTAGVAVVGALLALVLVDRAVGRVGPATVTALPDPARVGD